MPPLKRGRSWESYVFNGHFDAPANPFICFADGDAGGEGEGGDGAPPSEKTLSQSEVNKIVAREAKKAADKAVSEARAALEAEKAELAQKLADAEEAAKLATASAAEKEKHAQEKALKQQEAKLEAAERRALEAEAKATALEVERKQSAVNAQLGRALTDAKAITAGTSLAHATHFFAAEVKVETDEHGVVTSVTYDDVPQKDLKSAAEAWLQANPQYMTPPSGGSGTGHPGSAGSGSKNLAGKTSAQLGRSTTDLMAEGLKSGIGARQ